MKNKFILGLVAVGVMLATLSASAQSDLYKAPRSIVLSAPAVLTAAAATVTNGPIDIRGYLGIATVDITTCTNAGGALTALVEQSYDQTNWVALSNFGLISSTTSYSYTNAQYGGTNLIATNPYLLPGTITTPTASSGFATSYLAPVPFTNSGAITVTAKGVYRLGFVAQDARSYLHIIWTPTGSSSNDFVTAVFNGVRGAEVQ